MTSYKGLGISVLLAGAAGLAACSGPSAPNVAQALKDVEANCATADDSFRCVAAVNRSRPVLIAHSSADEKGLAAINQVCDQPIPEGGNADIEHAIQSFSALNCLSAIFDNTPADKGEVKLAAGIVSGHLQSYLGKRSRLGL